jgi:hypothetical protein
LVVDGRSVTRPLAVRMDPRLDDVTRADLREQFELARQIRDATSAANEAVVLIRTLRTQIQNRRARVDDGLPVAEQILDSLAAVERSLYQVKNESPKDKIAYPIKLNDRLAGLRAHLEAGDQPPIPHHIQVFRQLADELSGHLLRLHRVLDRDLPRLNDRLGQRDVKPVRRHESMDDALADWMEAARSGSR